MCIRIGIIYKINDQTSKNTAFEFIENSPFECFFLQEESDLKPNYVLTFGGDGTVLRAVPYAVKYNVPIIAINTGHLGFLCSAKSNELKDFCDMIKSGKLEFEQNNLIETKIGKTKVLSFNEITIQREVSNVANATAVEFELFINGHFADKYLSDGIVIATPNGSTAYSLSSGGAILTPDLQGMIITAICPHSLHNRPIVFSNKSKVEVLVERCDCACNVFSDGIFVGKVDKGQSIICKKSNKKILILKGENYFSKLNKKLRIWGNGG